MARRYKGIVLLVAVMLSVVPAVASAAVPVVGGPLGGWDGVGEWLSGLVDGWGGADWLQGTSEAPSDGSASLDGATDPDGTTTGEAPTPPDGELGPWKDPDGLLAGDGGGEMGS